MPDMPSVEVDFNDFDDNDRLGALLANADDPSAVHVGALVRLRDDDGNTAQGRVVELGERGQVWLDVLRPTWRSGPAETTDQLIASALANVVPPAGFFLVVNPTRSAQTAFAANVTSDLFVLTVGGLGVRLSHATHSPAGWPTGLGFADSYKLRSTSGAAPVTAELGP